MVKLVKRFTTKAPNRLLIYLLGVYVLIQFAWWAFMLVNLNAEIYQLKLDLLSNSALIGPERLIEKAQLDQKLSLRIWMVLGEGSVFVFLLLLGFWAVQKSISKELMVAKQQKNFLLSITHELKSPLAAIKLQLQTLNSRNLPEEKRLQIYSRALGDTDRLEKLVENLLLINKVESGGMPLNRKSTDVSEALIVQMKQTYPKELDENRIELSISRNISATIDELAFQSIVQNLVDNAIKYGSNGKIEVRLKATNNGFEFSVSDQGEGIPEKEKQKIFERFYRLGSEDVRKTKGTGIGLYIVKALVEKHKGKILVEDNQPQGSIFKVQLPTDLK